MRYGVLDNSALSVVLDVPGTSWDVSFADKKEGRELGSGSVFHLGLDI